MVPPTWDAVYRGQLERLRQQGEETEPTRGEAVELIGHQFIHTNPRDRILYGHPVFDVLTATGHWLWIMAGRMDLESIRYYNSNAAKFSVDKTKLHGAYGPRLFGIGVFDQINRLINLIEERGSTRRAVATVFSPEFDTFRRKVGKHEDEVPCTVSLQFLPRAGKLHAVTYMRSQDAFKLLPLDLFVFTLIHEYVAQAVGRSMGSYTHIAGSFHYYNKDNARVLEYQQGKPTTAAPMPAMPEGNQLFNLNSVIQIEEKLRNHALSLQDGKSGLKPRPYLRESDGMDEFWKQIVLALIGVAATRLNDRPTLEELLTRVHPSLQPAIRNRLLRDGQIRALDSYEFEVTGP